MTEPLIVFARITPKPEFLEAARQAILSIMVATRKEAECRTFALHEDRDGGGRLYLYEMWDDDAALAAHHNQPYTRSVFDSYREWLSEPVDITMLRGVGGDGGCSF